MFWCLGVSVWAFGRSGVDDIWEGQMGDHGRDLKMANNQHGVKPDIFKITPCR